MDAHLGGSALASPPFPTTGRGRLNEGIDDRPSWYPSRVVGSWPGDAMDVRLLWLLRQLSGLNPRVVARFTAAAHLPGPWARTEPRAGRDQLSSVSRALLGRWEPGAWARHAATRRQAADWGGGHPVPRGVTIGRHARGAHAVGGDGDKERRWPGRSGRPGLVRALVPIQVARLRGTGRGDVATGPATARCWGLGHATAWPAEPGYGTDRRLAS